jgi:amino acid permease
MIITFILKLIISIFLGAASMSLLLYLHLKTVDLYNTDVDKIGRVYSKLIGPTLSLLIFAVLLFK